MLMRIKEAREKAGYSQGQLADMLGISYATLSGYEYGKHDPKSETLSRIADLCKTSVDYLLGLTDVYESSDEKNRKWTAEQIDIINKFEALDAHGKLLVSTVLGIEYQRCSADPLADLNARLDEARDAYFASQAGELESKAE